jgi:glucose-1-phosphate adenylyltransferase
MQNVLCVLLAGGAGERLYPLTRDRAKPAVPFGGVYRIVDVTLSNCINSGLRRIFILTQYKSLSLNRHIRFGWNIFARELGEFIEIVPPMQRVGEHWYRGTADAVYQNIYSILAEDPEYVLILAADHIYKMNYALMLERHLETGADVTVGTIHQPLSEAHRLGVVTVDSGDRITGFLEKPQGQLLESLGSDGFVHASMGIYLFTASKLIEILREDASNPRSNHDFGRDILPEILNRYRVSSYNFVDENRTDAQYWRDVGTLDAYYEANMDLVSVSPIFNLYDREWPIRTLQEQNPPAKFVFAHVDGRMGVALDSIVSHGCIISGGRVVQSVLSPGVRVNSYAEVDRSILFSEVNVGRYARLRRCIVERGVTIPENLQIGYDDAKDRASGFTVTDSGIVVVSPESLLIEVEQSVASLS